MKESKLKNEERKYTPHHLAEYLTQSGSIKWLTLDSIVLGDQFFNELSNKSICNAKGWFMLKDCFGSTGIGE